MSLDETTLAVKHKQKTRTVIAGLLIIGLVVYAFQGKKGASGQANPTASQPSHSHEATVIPISAAKVTVQDIPVYQESLGTVTSLKSVTVKSRVDGELINVAFKEGQIVKAGDLLAEIDARPYEIQLQQAEGQLVRDEALLNNAKADLSRYQTLLRQDSISAQQAVTQQALVKQYQGTVAIDRAMLANAKLQLSFTKIKAPISGRLGLRLVDQGNLIHASDVNGLVVITQMQPIAVVFTIPEDALAAVMANVKRQTTPMVYALDRSGKTQLAEGRLLAIDNQIDVNTGTVKLKSQFDNTDGGLFANQFVTIKLLTDTLKSVTAIPGTALQSGVSGAFVYVIQEDQTVTQRPVKLGPRQDKLVAILAGLQSNEQVVIDGADKLKEGQKVKLIQPTANP